MSLATFKKKSIHSTSSAAKRSGKPTTIPWLYPGPYGQQGGVVSTIFQESIENTLNSGFSITGPYRNIGRVGTTMLNSQHGTPYRGIYPKGWGGTHGRYPDGPNEITLAIRPVQTGVAIQSNIVKPPVLSTKGMLARRFRWVRAGQYPNNWVQPIYTGNQIESASQGQYIHTKSSTHFCNTDVNNVAKYVNCIKNSCGCRRSSANEYATYTKTIRQPMDESERILRAQRKCQHPTGSQKPFPYAVQTGTGILKGGIGVTNVGSTCFIGEPVLSPPEWYTAH
jgi:hypothetical protein